MKRASGRRSATYLFCALLIMFVAGGCARSGGSPANSRTETAAGLSFAVPADWKSEAPATTMRVAQFSLPGLTPGDSTADLPELVVFFFGEGKGGDVASNIERWIGMIGGPDGKPATAAARRENRKVGAFTVSMVTVDGSYDAFIGMGMSGGMGGAHGTQAKPDYRLWGAVVEGPGGPWFFKATGPREAMKKAEPALRSLIQSLHKGA